MNRAAKLISAASLACAVGTGSGALAASETLCTTSPSVQTKSATRLILRNSAGVVVTAYALGLAVVKPPDHIVNIAATASLPDEWPDATYSRAYAFSTTSAADACAQRFMDLNDGQSLYVTYTDFTYNSGPYKGKAVRLVSMCTTVTAACTHVTSTPRPH